jgi:hypothetical protein
MRYTINFDKTINQLVPYYIGGRKLILYLQALMKPLQTLNAAFSEYAKEQRIEATMTSQIFYFEWFLNRKFSKYFLNGGQIIIKNGERLGVPIQWENADVDAFEDLLLYKEEEGIKNVALYHSNEQTDGSSHSFVVSSPAINTQLISIENYKAMLSHYIDKYRLSGKTYVIKINS